MALLALTNFRPGAFDVCAVSVPRGRVYEKLCRMAHIRVIPMELGGSERRPPRCTGIAHEFAEDSQAVPRLCNLVTRDRMDVIYTIGRTVADHLAQLISRLTRRPPASVPDGEVGRLVPPRDPSALGQAFIKSIEHPERAREIAERGR